MRGFSGHHWSIPTHPSSWSNPQMYCMKAVVMMRGGSHEIASSAERTVFDDDEPAVAEPDQRISVGGAQPGELLGQLLGRRGVC